MVVILISNFEAVFLMASSKGRYTDMKNITNSESYDIVFCSLCNRDAKLPEALDGFKACKKCGGFGFIIKEKQALKKNRRHKRARKDLPYAIRIKKRRIQYYESYGLL